MVVGGPHAAFGEGSRDDAGLGVRRRHGPHDAGPRGTARNALAQPSSVRRGSDGCRHGRGDGGHARRAADARREPAAGLFCLWFIVRGLDGYFTDGAVDQHLRQAIICLAMVRMFVLTAAGSPMAGMSMANLSAGSRAG